MQTSVLSVRISESERNLLEAAAAQSRTNLSDFVRRKAIEAAELEILAQQITIIPAADWEKFEAWVATPAETNSALKELADITPSWQR